MFSMFRGGGLQNRTDGSKSNRGQVLLLALVFCFHVLYFVADVPPESAGQFSGVCGKAVFA